MEGAHHRDRDDWKWWWRGWVRIKDSDVVLTQKSNNNNSDTYRAAER